MFYLSKGGPISRKGEKVRNICQKGVQLAEKGEKGEKVKNSENKLKHFGLFIYIYIYGLILHYNLLKLTRYFKTVKTLSSDLC